MQGAAVLINMFHLEAHHSSLRDRWWRGLNPHCALKDVWNISLLRTLWQRWNVSCQIRRWQKEMEFM